MQRSHQYYMEKALALAELGRETVSPNPMVGCVIVREDQVIAQAWHKKAGCDHAEVLALKQAGECAKGSTLYITLEPCAHTGRTPPCVNAIIKAGVARVVIAVVDPNPLVAGKGIAALKAANIGIISGCLEAAATELNKVFFHFHLHKRPYIIAKWAMSLDGKTITHETDNRFITDPSTQAHAHRIRNQVDAILIGAQTARMDDPNLTVRLDTAQIKQPRPIIITQSGHLPMQLNLFKQPSELIIITSELGSKNVINTINQKTLTIITVPTHSNKLDLNEALKQLANMNITSILVEGGDVTRNLFLSDKLIDEIHTYVAPVLIGDLAKKRAVNVTVQTQLKKDYFYRARLTEGETHV